MRKGAEVRVILTQRFPTAFAQKGQPKKPLKVSIFHDIRARCEDLLPQEINRAIADYVQGPRYAEAFVAGADRIDLDGNPCGVVTAEEVKRAALRASGYRIHQMVARALREARISHSAVERGVLKEMVQLISDIRQNDFIARHLDGFHERASAILATKQASA